ncbi:hypothetical protein HYC85_007750 [Camellia sinensis]|uniref:R3H-associated N-terminal domain-containing protein n=1 Tax=Camellia sinensis TaxID=4442 RepID=A0A7J7HS91_CAMSI|nr:hypothetical protein HYC85_007750 [Camellia sinensis]
MEVHAQAKRGFSVKEDEVASPADLSFEAPLKIVEYPDPILRTKNKRIDTFDDNLKKLVDEMFDVSNRRSHRWLNDRLLMELVPRLNAEEIRGLFAPPPWGEKLKGR